MGLSSESEIYADVMDAVRNRTARRIDLHTSIISVGGIAAAVVLMVFAIGLIAAPAAWAKSMGPLVRWFARIGSTGLARWISESESFLGYPTILFLHTLGLATLVGFSICINVRLLGVAHRIPITALLRLFPLMWFGFWLNAASGVLLFIGDPIRKSMNSLFEIKLALVALGVAVMALIQSRLGRIEEKPYSEERWKAGSRLLAVASLLIWAGAITAGRLLAYIKGL